LGRLLKSDEVPPQPNLSAHGVGASFSASG
jgi:hypothetical protein